MDNERALRLIRESSDKELDVVVKNHSDGVLRREVLIALHKEISLKWLEVRQKSQGEEEFVRDAMNYLSGFQSYEPLTDDVIAGSIKFMDDSVRQCEYYSVDNLVAMLMREPTPEDYRREEERIMKEIFSTERTGPWDGEIRF